MAGSYGYSAAVPLRSAFPAKGICFTQLPGGVYTPRRHVQHGAGPGLSAETAVEDSLAVRLPGHFNG